MSGSLITPEQATAIVGDKVANQLAVIGRALWAVADALGQIAARLPKPPA